MVMDRIVWTRLHTVILAAVSVMLLVAIGFTVRANETGPGTRLKCYSNLVPGQLACFNIADGKHTTVTRNFK
jgi:hypothetical protein